MLRKAKTTAMSFSSANSQNEMDHMLEVGSVNRIEYAASRSSAFNYMFMVFLKTVR